jgi:hypothetical protein
MPFQGRAWLRLYGLPLHAWNEKCFELCVLDCGCYLRRDNCSLGRKLFDFARVLIATSFLDFVNLVDKILVDGVLVEVKIIEEWRFNLGEDAFLFEEKDGSKSSCSDHADVQGDPEAGNHVDILVDKIVEELAEEEHKDLHNLHVVHYVHVESETTVRNDFQATPDSSETVSHMASSFPFPHAFQAREVAPQVPKSTAR